MEITLNLTDYTIILYFFIALVDLATRTLFFFILITAGVAIILFLGVAIYMTIDERSKKGDKVG